MSLLPGDASWAEQVSDLFLYFAGRGCVTSPNDADLIMAWQATGCPPEVVGRGIHAAYERVRRNGRPGEWVRTLRACKRDVEAEIKRWSEANVGARKP